MIYFLRHGLDDERFIGGHSNIPLTNIGIKQVEKVTDYIIRNKLIIKKIYTSDVKRAVQTSLIVNEALNVEVLERQYLRELDKGLLTGLSSIDVYKLYSEYLNSKDIGLKYPNGESLLDLYYRIKKFLPIILSKDNSLIVSHRGVINMIYTILNNQELTLDKERFNVEHASLHEFDISLKKMRRIY